MLPPPPPPPLVVVLQAAAQPWLAIAAAAAASLSCRGGWRSTIKRRSRVTLTLWSEATRSTFARACIPSDAASSWSNRQRRSATAAAVGWLLLLQLLRLLWQNCRSSCCCCCRCCCPAAAEAAAAACSASVMAPHSCPAAASSLAASWTYRSGCSGFLQATVTQVPVTLVTSTRATLGCRPSTLSCNQSPGAIDAPQRVVTSFEFKFNPSTPGGGGWLVPCPSCCCCCC